MLCVTSMLELLLLHCGSTITTKCTNVATHSIINTFSQHTGINCSPSTSCLPAILALYLRLVAHYQRALSLLLRRLQTQIESSLWDKVQAGKCGCLFPLVPSNEVGDSGFRNLRQNLREFSTNTKGVLIF